MHQYRVTLSRRVKRGDGFETKYSFRLQDLERLPLMISDAKQQILEHEEGVLEDVTSDDSQAE